MGKVLKLANIDLTNRCNLNCPVCFANSNAAGYVYEPTFDQVVTMMQRLRDYRPTPATCIQFSGGEPTLHPDFLQIVSKAAEMGFSNIQIATNGLKLAEASFASQAAKAGLHTLYLQFDGVDDQINLGTQIVDLAGPFSISFWFATNNSKSQFLFGRAGGATSPGAVIFVASSGALAASLTDDNGDGASIISQGAYDFTGYAHLAVVRSDTQLKLYVDGVLRGERDLSLSTITPDSLRIATYAGMFAECMIDDFRVYDRALDLNEIETLWQMGEA
ncbi:hypothetical protein LCGC14_1510930 [marine sediment metagenome]|uniref:Uncharacterized protein n=1 Tax=marine sediment metagenome TaxID=412755 RepID=A0A0F9LGU6_9ZZZZ